MLILRPIDADRHGVRFCCSQIGFGLGDVFLGIEAGLAAVVATQLWHHLYIDSSLADLPVFSVQCSVFSNRNGRPYRTQAARPLATEITTLKTEN